MINLTPTTQRPPAPPPAWALAQRNLIRAMNEAAPAFQARYTRADGSFIWREQWPGMDGSDDGYESWHNWPLLCALGGADELYPRSRFLWEAVTRQFTEYGQVWREFDAYYDWMHHGESSLLLYYFGLCDPRNPVDIGRVRRFAAMYMGDDPLAPNWDAERKQMRSPITGSKGPRLENSWEDWETHRAVLANYPAPFEDIPGAVSTPNGPVADWNDDAIYGEILKRLNARQMQGDVPLNLTATSLITHAFLYTGEDRYRQWVTDYLEAWAERIEKNDGLCPDNVGPNGIVGENLDGKWWGGYYGWRWPHGFMTILQPLLIAAMNAVLLTGDQRYLDIPRGQLDRILDLGREENGVLLTPHRHTDGGWTAYRPMSAELPLQLAYFSHAAEDFARLERFPQRETKWKEVPPGRGKGDDIHIAPWHCYLQGGSPAYPDKILAAQWMEMARRMERMRSDDGDPETWDVHHWQDINPVHTEGLIQLTLGGPQVIYHGGLLHVRMRHWDAEARRPGLPPDVAVLVYRLDADSVTATFANTSLLASRHLIVQAGAFGEHQWTDATIVGADAPTPAPVDGPYVSIDLPPASLLDVRLGMRRFANTPRYASPFATC
jgi:hypothetical protein